MLTKAEHPVAWAMLMYELADAREHLDALIDLLAAEGAMDGTDFGVQLGQHPSHT